jgi:vacuolar-type H+-ATPase subunit F/Vma7
MMQYAVGVLCSPAVATGFRLAGLSPIEAADPADGGRLLRESLLQPRLGVLLVEDRIYRNLSETVRRSLSRRALPMVVPFPGPAWAPQEKGPEALIAELLRQAIGYRVRLA